MAAWDRLYYIPFMISTFHPLLTSGPAANCYRSLWLRATELCRSISLILRATAISRWEDLLILYMSTIPYDNMTQAGLPSQLSQLSFLELKGFVSDVKRWFAMHESRPGVRYLYKSKLLFHTIALLGLNWGVAIVAGARERRLRVNTCRALPEASHCERYWGPSLGYIGRSCSAKGPDSLSGIWTYGKPLAGKYSAISSVSLASDLQYCRRMTGV